jgi:NitT/TauT family transport system substrate-binding protein
VLRKLFLLFLPVFVLAGCTSHKGKSDNDKEALRVGLAIPSYVHAVAWIGQDKEHFKDAGTAVKISVMGGSAATMRGLVAGSIDIGIGGGDAVLKANAAGADLVVIAGLVNGFYHRIIGRKGVTRLDQLRGGKIGLPFLGGPQHMAVRYALRDRNLAEAKVKTLNLGKDVNRMAALTRGDIDATTSQTPVSRLKELGFHVLADLPAQKASFPYAVIAVRQTFLESNHLRVKSFLTGLRVAVKYYRSHETESLEVIRRYLKGSDSAAVAHERYATAGPSKISPQLLPDPKGFELVQSFLDRPNNIKIDKLIDLSLLKSLDKLEDGKE